MTASHDKDGAAPPGDPVPSAGPATDPAAATRLAPGALEATAAPPPGSAPPTPSPAPASAPLPDFSLIGRRLGPYRITAQLGAGGMGAVYLADQLEPVRRQVALKVIKAGMDSEDILDRFRSERALLARMQHPNIAQVLDVGATEEGRLFFAMEYVPGLPLVEFCDRRGMDLAHRLELFLQVCEGVQHAHQKGVIHRDLKPGNLLVADYQGQMLVKVIDFGIAKSLDARGRPETGSTMAGVPIGTPAYMSPEQAVGDPEAIDTRTDVYSLGVVLYRLITGEQPIASEVLARTTELELPRVLREAEIPPPSRRVATMGRDGRTEWKRAMATDPVAHARRLRGEMDWITLRALERERDRRYASVSEFAADIRRFLAGEPVLAGPPSQSYRIRKFIARNRVAVGAAAAVLVALVLGVIGTTWMAVEARAQRERAEAALADAQAQRDRAEAEGARARAAQSFLENLIAAPDPWKLSGASAESRNVRVVDALAGASTQLEATLADDAGLRAEVATLLGRTLRRLGQYDAAARQLEIANTAAAEAFGPDAPQRVQAELERGLLLAERGQGAQAKAAITPLLGRLAVPGLASGSAEEARRAAAEIAQQLGEPKEAERLARENLAATEAASGNDSTAASGARASLAEILGAQGQWDEADRLLREAYDAERRRLGPAHPLVLQLLSRSANLGLRKGDYALAEQRYREAALAAEQVLGAEHPETLRYRAHVATALSNAGRNEEAVAEFERVLPVRARVLGADHPDVLTLRANYAIALRALKRADDAQSQMGEVYQRRRVVLGETHPETMRTLAFLAAMSRDRGDLPRAEFLLQQAVDLFRQVNGEDHPETLVMENNRLAIARDRGDLGRAIEGYAALLARAEKALPPGLWHLDAIRGNYGKALYRDRRFAEAEPLVLASWRGLRAQFPDTDPRVGGARERVVELYAGWNRKADADAVLAEPRPEKPSG
ncbi:MAG: serine/threonine-protein kinase [Xanthomonadaceae bacterium]|nr:serine/threonine-protein kinase [Xanthomonadaceae bacterium]